MEAQRMGLGEKIGSLFSRRLAEKKWVMNHREQIQQYAKMAEALPESERAKVYASIEHDMQEATGKQLKINRVVAGVTLTAATFVGALIGIPGFRNWVGGLHIGKVEFGKPFKTFGEKGATKFGDAAVRAKELGRKAKDGLVNLFMKKEAAAAAPPPPTAPPSPAAPVIRG